jgi:hypothetical protein
MGLGCAPHQPAINLRDRGDDVDPAPVQIHFADPKCSDLAPAQTGVGEHADERRVPAALLRQHRDLGVIEVPVLLQRGPGHRDPGGRVPREPAVLHGPVEHLAQTPWTLATERGAIPCRESCETQVCTSA